MMKNGKKLLFVLALVFFAAVALISGYKACSILAEYRQGEQTAEELQQFIDFEATKPAPTEPGVTMAEDREAATEQTETAQSQVVYPAVDFEALLEQNSDVVGWIYLEDTNINYPIVQGTDNQYYVDHMVNGQVNGAGSIFMDFRNEPDFSDAHTVIYGHNMKNKTMFAHLSKYRDPDFFASHPTGKIMTPEGNFQIEVIAGYVASLDEEAWRMDFEDDGAFLAWLQDTMDRSIIGGSYVPDAADRIITLSTCSYEFEDARFVLVCRILK